MEVIAFIEPCGHTLAVDVSTPRQKLKVLAQILQEAVEENKLPYNEDVDEEAEANIVRCLVGTANTLLGTKAPDHMLLPHIQCLEEYIQDSDITVPTRDGLTAISVLTEWPRGCLS